MSSTTSGKLSTFVRGSFKIKGPAPAAIVLSYGCDAAAQANVEYYSAI